MSQILIKNWILGIYSLILFIFQFTIIPVSATPITFEQDRHIGTSESYTYGEASNSISVESGYSGKANWMDSKSEVGSGNESMLLIVGNAAKMGFSSFNAFKKAYGSAGKGNAWHHIVEQGGNNVRYKTALEIFKNACIMY